MTRGDRRNSPARAARDALHPALFVRQLEERRVLNGAPLIGDPALEQLVFDAGNFADDGSADTFEVTRQGDDVRVAVNDTELYVGRLDDVGQLRILGSSDADTLVVDFSGGDPSPGGGIFFDGMGHPSDAQDRLVLNPGSLGQGPFGQGITSVTHELHSLGDGLIQVHSPDRAATDAGTSIIYTGVEAVDDALAADRITVNLSADTATLTLSNNGVSGDGRSLMTLADGRTISLANPAESLTIDAADPSPQTIHVEGLDAAFRADLVIRGDALDTIDFSGDVDLAGNDLSVEAGTIQVDRAITSHGATVHLDAGEGGTLLVSGRIDVSNATLGQAGGTVHLFGGYVGLYGDALIDASGDAGGGTILVGGDYQGANPNVRNALRTYVGSGVTLRADALGQGDGGTIIAWADEVTRYFGHAGVRGGALGGDAGLVEVSGLDALVFEGTVDLDAPHGTAGQLLLDPTVLNIVEAGGSLDGGFAGTVDFTDGGASESISIGTIEGIGAGTVLLRALQTINVADLDATVGDGAINLQNDVNIILETRNSSPDGDGTGGIVFADPTNVIVTQGTGTISLFAGTAATPLTATLSNIGVLSSNTGDILLVANGDATLAGAISTFGGAVTVTTNGAITVNAPITVGGTGDLILAAGGSGNDITLGATVTAGDDMHLRASRDILQPLDTVYIICDDLLLQAGRDVGTASGADAIDLQVNTVAAESGLSADPGNIFLNQDTAGGTLSVNTVVNLIDTGTVSGVVVGSTNGTVDIRTEADSLSIDQAVTARGTGDLILATGGAGSDLTLAATVTAGDDAHLRAGQDILQPLDSVFVVADGVYLQAGRSIGTATGAAAIDLQVNTVIAHSGLAADPGDIFLNQDAGAGTLTINTVDNLIDGGTVDHVLPNGTNGQVSIVTEDDDLTLGDNVTAIGTGTLELTAGGVDRLFTLSASAAVDSADRAITITADHMDLDATATIGGNAETVTLQQHTATATIEFVADATADASGVLRLDDLDLDALANVNGLVLIGRNDGGDIGVVEAFDLTADATALHLRTGGGVAGAGQTIGIADLAVTAGKNSADDAVTIQTAVDTSSVAVEIQRRTLISDTLTGSAIVNVDTTGIQAGDRISIADDDGATELFTVLSVDNATQLTLSGSAGNDYTTGQNAIITLDVDVTVVEPAGQGSLAIGTVNGVSGVTGTSGAISVSTTDAGASLIVNQPVGLNTIALGAGVAESVTLTAAGANSLIDQNAQIATGDGPVTLVADNMELDDGTIDSGAAATTLTVWSAGATISLGDSTASDADLNLELSDAELETITTTSGIVVGAVAAGNITIRHEDPINLDDVNLTLITGGSIGDSGNAAATITLNDTGGPADAILTLDTSSGVGGVNGNDGDALGIDVAGLAARTRADSGGAGGNIRVSDSDTLAITTARNVTIAFAGVLTADDTNGGDEESIDVEVIAGDLTVDQPITAADTGDVLLDIRGAGADLVLNANVIADDDVHLRVAQDILQTSGDVYIEADGLLLQAGQRIGTAAGATAIHTRVNTLAARSGLSADPGNIFLNEDAAGGTLSLGTVDDLFLGGTVTGVVVGSANGTIDVRTEAGSMTIDQALTAPGTGNLILVAGGAGSDLTLNAAATATAGADLQLQAGRDISLGATVTAGDDAHLRAGRDILQPLDTVFVVADAALLDAGRHIGTAAGVAAIDLRVNTVAARSGRTDDPGSTYLVQDFTSGALVVGSADNLFDGGTVDGVTGGGTGGVVDVRTEAGTLTINRAVTAQGTSNLILDAVGAASNITMAADVAAGNDAHLRAGNEILQPLDSVHVIVANGLLMQAGHRIGNAAGATAIDMRANVVAAVSGISGDPGGVFLNEDAAGGALVIGTANNLIAGGTESGVRLSAASGPVDIRTENGGLTINQSVSAQGTGDLILVATGGDLTLGATVRAGDDAHLRAGNDILQPLDSVYVVADALFLEAGRGIGTAVGAAAVDLRVITLAARAGTAGGLADLFISQDTAAGNLLVGTVDNLVDGGTIAGVVVGPANGSIDLRTESGHLTVSEPVETLGTGNIVLVTNGGGVAVNDEVSTAISGNISMQANGGNVEVNALVSADVTGDVLLQAAGGNVVVHNVPALGVGAGEVVADAIVLNSTGNQVVIDNQAILVSASGQVTNAPPILNVVDSGTLLGPGNAVEELFGLIGGDALLVPGTNDEWGRNFTLTIFWADPAGGGGSLVNPDNPGTRMQTVVTGIDAGDAVDLYVAPDGSISSLTITPGTQPDRIQLHLRREYSAVYVKLLNVPSIATTVLLRNDANIDLFDFEGTANEHLNEVAMRVWTGVDANFVIPTPMPEKFAAPVAPAIREMFAPPPARPTAPPPVGGSAEIRFRGETVVEEGRRLYLVKVLPDGTEEKKLDLPEDALSDLSDWLDRFKEREMPDGLYRIYLWERGLRRKVIEFFKSKDTIGEPPREPGRGANPTTVEQSALPQSRRSDAQTAQARQIDRIWEHFETAAGTATDSPVEPGQPEPVTAMAQRPTQTPAGASETTEQPNGENNGVSGGVTNDAADPDEPNGQGLAASSLAAGAALGVVAAPLGRTRWSAASDRVMEDADEASFGKVARWCRRFRRQIGM